MFGLTVEKLLFVGLLAAVLVGPSRPPAYAARLGEIVRVLRAHVDAARSHAEAETGTALDGSNWAAVDPRQYDPRRIVREALAEQPRPADDLDVEYRS